MNPDGGPIAGASGDDCGPATLLVWYVAYGSNLAWGRFECYLRGGIPPGGRRANPGARDPSPPRASRALWLPGTVYFALESSVWSGGMAFYDADEPGSTPARAYLITAEQFSDVMAQEMRRDVGANLDLGEVLTAGRSVLGSGRYEHLVGCGDLQGHPALTATAPWPLEQAALNAPAGPYLDTLAAGLAETHGWTRRACADYLTALPGARDTWTLERLLRRWDRPGD